MRGDRASSNGETVLLDDAASEFPDLRSGFDALALELHVFIERDAMLARLFFAAPGAVAIESLQLCFYLKHVEWVGLGRRAGVAVSAGVDGKLRFRAALSVPGASITALRALDAKPFDWSHPKAASLQAELSGAYSNQRRLERLGADAGVKLGHWRDYTREDACRSLIEEATQQDKLRALIGRALEDDSCRGYHDLLRPFLADMAPENKDGAAPRLEDRPGVGRAASNR